VAYFQELLLKHGFKLNKELTEEEGKEEEKLSHFMTKYSNHVVSTQTEQTDAFCAVCDEGGVLRCGKCGEYYCSKECQKKAWKEHKPICNLIAIDSKTAPATLATTGSPTETEANRKDRLRLEIEAVKLLKALEPVLGQLAARAKGGDSSNSNESSGSPSRSSDEESDSESKVPSHDHNPGARDDHEKVDPIPQVAPHYHEGIPCTGLCQSGLATSITENFSKTSAGSEKKGTSKDPEKERQKKKKKNQKKKKKAQAFSVLTD